MAKNEKKLIGPTTTLTIDLAAKILGVLHRSLITLGNEFQSKSEGGGFISLLLILLIIFFGTWKAVKIYIILLF